MKTFIKQNGRFPFTLLLLVLLTTTARAVPTHLEWGSFDADGSDAYGVYDSDGVTPLASYAQVDLMWAGADGQIDPPTCMGEATGDDLILDATAVLNGAPLPTELQNKGYVPFKLFTFDSTDTAVDGTLYLRGWNSYSPLAATAYGNSETGLLEGTTLFRPGRWHTDQLFTSCGEPPPPPTEAKPIYLPFVQTAVAAQRSSFSTQATNVIEDFGGGGHEFGHEEHLTEVQRQEIEKQIATNITQLEAEQGSVAFSSTAVTLNWPLQPNNSFDDYSYYGISNFVDHNLGYPNQLTDYMCGDRSYDTGSGYNHRGTDFFLWPNPWQMMADDTIEVVAAAAGIIVHKQDGNGDQSCTSSNAPWNAVYVQHGDGSIAWYGHLKKGSLTNKQVGQSVTTGEFLGLVGSSGNSTDPHLHFELFDADGKLIDPYAGTCNTLNSQSWWAEQRPYYDSTVNKLMTGHSQYGINSCPNTDTPNIRNNFAPGDLVYFTTFYRDQLNSQTSRYTIYRPNGTIYHQWSHNSDEDHYAASYWWWSVRIGAGEPQGEWRFVVSFDGGSYQHEFLVGGAPTPADVDGLQLAAGDEGLTLAWTAVTQDRFNQPLTVQSYNIYRSDEPYFEPSPSNLLTSVDSPSFVDEALTDEMVFYQVTAVNQFGGESLLSPTIGKVTVDLYPGWNLLSLPLLPTNGTLADILGAQLHGTADPTTADQLLVWDGERQQFERAWRCAGAGCELFGPAFSDRWLDGDYALSQLTLAANGGFWLHNRSGEMAQLHLTGLVAVDGRSVPVESGWQLLGSAFPFEQTLTQLNLPVVGSDLPETADTLLYWNPATQQYERAWFCSGANCEAHNNQWLTDQNTPSDLAIPIGHGFWLHNQHSSFTWTNDAP